MSGLHAPETDVRYHTPPHGLRRSALIGAMAAVALSVLASCSSPPATSDVGLSLPGTVVGQGRYVARLGPWSAGSEDFLITRTEAGYDLMAHCEPNSAFDKPALLTVHVGPGFTFLSAEWRRLTGDQLVARYTSEGGSIRAEATQAGQALPAQTLKLPDGAIVTAASYASDAFLVGVAQLAVGEKKTFQAVSFGYPSWQMSIASLTLAREPDTDLTRPDGSKVKACSYTSRIQTRKGTFNGQIWTDQAGIVLQSTLKLSLGSVVATRE